ncbi:hypothetical protein DXG01_003548, partial [Tephrocybe rancida]
MSPVAPKPSYGTGTLAAKAPCPPHTAPPKPLQLDPKQLKDVPPPASIDINKEACKRCVANKTTCYIHLLKDGKEGACHTCNAKEESCNLVLKGKGKVQDQAGAPGNKGVCKGKGKVMSLAYVVDTDEEYEEDEDESEDKDEQP